MNDKIITLKGKIKPKKEDDKPVINNDKITTN